jgi:hypothetical protein
MPDATTKLQIVLEAKDNASKSLTGLKSKLENLQPAFKKMATVGGLAFGSLVAGATMSVKAFAESEAQMARANTTLETISDSIKKSGMSMDQARKKTADFGVEMMKLAGVSDEEASIALSRLWQVTKDYTKAQEMARLATDLSIYKQIDLASATDVVAKVYNGNTAILTRYGIEIDKNATKEQALATLMGMTKGQAEAYGKTLEGQSKILKESFGNLQESIGQLVATALVPLVQKLIPIIEKITNWISENPELAKTLGVVALVVTGLVATIGTLGMILPKVITGVQLLATAFTVMGTALLPITAGLTAIILALNQAIGLYKDLKGMEESQAGEQEQFNKFMARVKELRAEGKTEEANRMLQNARNVYGFAEGGIVPGPVGKAVPAIVHGGETIIPADKKSIGNTFNFNFAGAFIGNKEAFISEIKKIFNRESELKSLAGI